MTFEDTNNTSKAFQEGYDAFNSGSNDPCPYNLWVAAEVQRYMDWGDGYHHALVEYTEKF